MGVCVLPQVDKRPYPRARERGGGGGGVACVCVCVRGRETLRQSPDGRVGRWDTVAALRVGWLGRTALVKEGGGRGRELRGKLLGMGPAAYVTAHGKAKPEHEKRNNPARRGGFHARQSASTQRYPTSAPPPSRPRARAPPDPIHAPPRTRSPPDAPSPRRRHPNSSFQTTKMADDEVAALVVDNGSGMSMSHVQVAGFGNLAHTEGCRPSEPSSCSL